MSPRRPNRWSLSFLVASSITVAACSDDANDDDAAPQSTTSTVVTRVGEPVELGDESSFFVRLSPQESDGTVVVIDEVVLTEAAGFVVVYADGDGAPGQRIGASTLLEPGRTSDVAVTLDEPLESTGLVHAMLHLDDDGNGQLDFPAHDQPATADEGGIVVVAAEVTVRE